jgi:hypothetical protein
MRPHELSVVDPNPEEPAEYSLTILTRPNQEIDADRLIVEIVMLYDQKSSWSLIQKVLNDLRRMDIALVYVGSRGKCEKWSEIFREMELVVEIEKV